MAMCIAFLVFSLLIATPVISTDSSTPPSHSHNTACISRAGEILRDRGGGDGGGGAPSFDGSYNALLVGLNYYSNTDEDDDLDYTDEDVKDWKNFLENQWEDKNYEIRVLTDENGTSGAIYDHLAALSDSDSDDTQSVFTFAGHGGYGDVDGDGDDESVIYGVNSGEVTSEELDSRLDFKGGKDYLHFDTCHSGGFDVLGEDDSTTSVDPSFIGMAVDRDHLAKSDETLENGIFTYYTLKYLKEYSTVEGAWDDIDSACNDKNQDPTKKDGSSSSDVPL